MNDYKVIKYLTPRKNFTIFSAIKYYLQHTLSGDIMYSIYVNGNYVGNCGFYKRKKDTCELRIIIGAVNFWGKGIGYEAVLKMIDNAKKNNYMKIWLHVDPNNKRAINLYKKVGFVPTHYVNISNTVKQIFMILSIND